MRDDRTLVREALDGDGEAIADLVRRHAGRLHRYFVVAGTRDHDAEDLVQETFIKVHRHLARYDERYSFTTWLYTIGRRTRANFLRALRPATVLEDDMVGDQHHPGARLEAEEDHGIWGRARRVLTARQFEALWLFYGEERSVRDCAAILGIGENNCKVTLHRARKTLAAALAGADGDEVLVRPVGAAT